MNDDPDKAEVDKAIMDVALRELDQMPVGSRVMISEGIAFKKMSFWWNVRVWGLWKTLKIYVKEHTKGPK